MGKRMHINRISVWRLQRRHPGLDAWCDGILREGNAHRWGGIERRMAQLAEQGSVQHAEVYCKMQTNAFAPRALGGIAVIPGEQEPGAGVVINLLVPRPELPQGALPARPTVAAPRADIPTLAL